MNLPVFDTALHNALRQAQALAMGQVVLAGSPKGATPPPYSPGTNVSRLRDPLLGWNGSTIRHLVTPANVKLNGTAVQEQSGQAQPVLPLILQG